ncbi:hypothetical protein [Sporolactobacillus inulinus]|uniref:Uncharacterized protein n=1 Tax=Sporolactobacillus inulinus CASD TaxID=1069536 RepID=A0A0U1QPF4_9BACL|nr:hypothetical protein [Sporolactobacillus inulinus]KLI02680.1 hypothetical protein SINU_06585 [Sporolactobacillus inulinus CASD]GEB76027.1 hypothetical protein SIN01_03720 [Sporolactobacillus inulinus]
MIVSSLQIWLCYGLVGLIMGSMIGFFPMGRRLTMKYFALILLAAVVWLPVVILSLLAAPIANHYRLQETDF